MPPKRKASERASSRIAKTARRSRREEEEELLDQQATKRPRRLTAADKAKEESPSDEDEEEEEQEEETNITTKGAATKAKWSTVEGTMYVLDGKDLKPSAKIASFDMVPTLLSFLFFSKQSTHYFYLFHFHD